VNARNFENEMHMTQRGCICLAIVATLALPARAPAQSPAAPDAMAVGTNSTASCRPDTSSDGAFDFVRQSLTTVDVTIVQASELIALNQRIAGAVRSALGVSDTLLPRADTLDYAEDVGRLPLTIVVHRDAPATWHVDAAMDSTGAAGDTADARFANLYDLVLGTMGPNDLRIAWPTGAARDSAEIHVRLQKQVHGGLDPGRATNSTVLIFKALHATDPDGAPVLARGGPFFPSYHVMNGVAWRVVMEATIDAYGNVEKKSVHDIRSMASASDSAHFDYSYQKIVDAARQAMLHSKYVPAHHNGCAVEQIVRQAFYVNPGALR